MQEFEIFLMIDEDGNAVATMDRDTLQERYAEDIGSENMATRIIAIKVNAPLPKPVEVLVTVPEQPSAASVAVKAE